MVYGLTSLKLGTVLCKSMQPTVRSHFLEFTMDCTLIMRGSIFPWALQ